MLGILIFLPFKGSAQNYHFKRYTSEEGLSVNTINKVVQDKSGIIWVGSFDGLNRFNGYNFDRIRNQKRANELILGNEIVGLFADSKNRIWVGTPEGLSVFTYLKGEPRFFKADSSGFPPARGYTFAEGSDKIWVGTLDGLAYYDEDIGKLKRVENVELANTPIKQLYTHKSDVYAATPRGLYVYRASNKLWERLIEINVLRVCIPADGQPLMLVQGGIIWLQKDGKIDTLPPLPIKGIIRAIITDRQKRLWIACSEGLLQYDFLSNTYKVFVHDEFNVNSLSASDILDLFEDQHGAIWISTVAGGVNVFDPRIENFELMSSPVFNGKGVFNNAISSITEDAMGKVYVGTSRGLAVVDKTKGVVRNYLPNQLKEKGPLNKWIRGLCTDKEGKVWVGTAGGGVSCYEPKTDLFKHYTQDSSDQWGLPSNYVYSVFCSNNGDVYACTSKGVGKFDNQLGRFRNLSIEPLYANLNGEIVWRIDEDNSGRFLVSVPNKGVYRFDPKKRNVTWFGTSDQAQVKINDIPVWGSFQDAEGQYWFGTNHGLTVWNESTDFTTYYNTNNGLPDDVIYGFLNDANQNIWMSSNKGLIRYIPESNSFLNYTTNDGLQSNEFNQEALFKSKSGLLYFGGVKGYNYFDPMRIGVQRVAPDCIISDVSIQVSQSIRRLSLEPGEALTLGYLQDVLHIEFGVLDYYHSGKALYRYRLRELDENWISGNKINKVIYSNLPPGYYHFQVQASINGTDWSAIPAEMVFIIKPPFYRTWWFVVLLIALLLYFTYLLSRLRINQVKRKAGIQTQIGELKMAALRAQMNPHFIFNSLNSIQHLILKSDTEQAFSYLSKFSKLLRMILETSDKSFIKLEKEIDILKLYLELEKLRFDRQLNIYFELVEEDDWAGLKIPTLMLQPYVENAIWHGILPKEGSKKLWIRVRVTNGNLILEIEDNGIGRKKSSEIKSLQPVKYESKSMEINANRLSLIEEKYRNLSKIEIIDLTQAEEATGTLVRITFPVEALIIYE